MEKEEIAMNRLFSFLSLFVFSLVMSTLAFAQDAADKINGIADKIPVEGAAIVASALVLEVILRLVKSPKPLSLLLLAAKILHAGSHLLDKGAVLLDKVVPQRTSE